MEGAVTLAGYPAPAQRDSIEFVSNGDALPMSPSERLRLVLATRDALQVLPSEDAYLTLVLFNVIGFEEENRSTAEMLAALKDETLMTLAEHFGLIATVTPDEGTDSSARGRDAYAELVAAETSFRWVVREVLGDTWQGKLNEDQVDNLKQKCEEEDKRRDGVRVSQELLDYTETYELEKLILKNWAAVQPILNDHARTKVYLGIMLDIRNTIAHSRPLTPSEKLLLAGVAGQVQNQLSVYRSSSSGPTAYYASINYVRDSLGRLAENHYGVPPPRACARLEVDQHVVLDCSGSDPRGRLLTWEFKLSGNHNGMAPVALGTAEGDTVTFDWRVTEDHVGEGRTLSVYLHNPSKFQRLNFGDESVSLTYDVNPPRY